MAERDARVVKWADLPRDRPMPLIERQRVIGSHMMVSRVELTKGFAVPTHQHENEQIAMVMSGKLKFALGADGAAGGKEVVVGAGGVVVLPPNLPHSAEALEDTVVLDLFSPPSEKTGVDRG